MSISEATAQGQVLFGGFRKKTYRLGELFQDIGALTPRASDIYAIYMKRRLDPLFREAIMVAVARANECRFCNFVHGQWALTEGLSEEDLNRIGKAEGLIKDSDRQLALAYVQSLASENFAPLSRELEEALHSRFSEITCWDIETVARVMALANRCANTLEAFIMRVKGDPSAHSRLIDELIIGLAFSAVYPMMMIVLAILQRRSPLSVARDFWRS